MPRLACLHSAPSNIAVFAAAARDLDLPRLVLTHRVRADLLVAAEAAGDADDAMLAETAEELRAMADGADAVLLTCSTLGRATAFLGDCPVPVLRADQALAEAAVADGGSVLVLCAVHSTLRPTRALFEGAAAATGARIEVRLVPGAWERFRAGDQPGYFTAIAEAADSAAGAAATIALAQVSMAGAAAHCRLARPLTSPPAALAAACAAAGGSARRS